MTKKDIVGIIKFLKTEILFWVIWMDPTCKHISLGEEGEGDLTTER